MSSMRAAMERSFAFTVFRRASVGWAVNVGSMSTSSRTRWTVSGSASPSANDSTVATRPSSRSPSCDASRMVRTRSRSSARLMSSK